MIQSKNPSWQGFIQVKHREGYSLFHLNKLWFFFIFFFVYPHKYMLNSKKMDFGIFWFISEKKNESRTTIVSTYETKFSSTQIMKKAASHVSCPGCSFMILHVLLFFFFFFFSNFFFVQNFKLNNNGLFFFQLKILYCKKMTCPKEEEKKKKLIPLIPTYPKSFKEINMRSLNIKAIINIIQERE